MNIRRGICYRITFFLSFQHILDPRVVRTIYLYEETETRYIPVLKQREDDFIRDQRDACVMMPWLNFTKKQRKA